MQKGTEDIGTKIWIWNISEYRISRNQISFTKMLHRNDTKTVSKWAWHFLIQNKIYWSYEGENKYKLVEDEIDRL